MVYQLRMSEKEYVCLCYDICHETEEEFDKAKNIIIADSKREQDEEHIIVQGCMYGLIFLTGLFGKNYKYYYWLVHTRGNSFECRHF